MKQRKGLRDWLVLHKREKKGREDKRDKGGKPFHGKVYPNNREAEESTRISGYRWGQKCLVSIEMGNWEENSC